VKVFRCSVLATLCCSALLFAVARQDERGSAEVSLRFTFDHGAIVRGSLSHKRIALILTGGDYGEGTGPILDALANSMSRVGSLLPGHF
jgi:hypothetical protein